MSQDIATKDQILALLQAERDRWEGLIAELGEDRLTAPALPGGESVKDLLAQIAGWQEEAVRRLEAAIHDEPPKPSRWPDTLSDDEINARIIEAAVPRPLDDILVEWRHNFDQMVGLVRRLPEEPLFDPDQFPWMDGEPVARAPLAAYELMHDKHWKSLQDWLAGRGEGGHGA